MVRLGCVGCGAPLEIEPERESFACGFCGTTQLIERGGGAIALKKLQAGLRAVQSGADRAAAELAMPRLQRELEEASAERASRVAGELQRLSSARRRRSKVAWSLFFGLLVGFVLLIGSPTRFSGSGAVLYTLVWLGLSAGVPVLVYRSTRMPVDRTKDLTAEVDQRIDRLRAHIASQRAILDRPPAPESTK